MTGYSNLPVTQAPGGQPDPALCAVPGSRYTNAGEAWRQVRNHWIIPHGAALFAIVLLALGIFYFVKGRWGMSIRRHRSPPYRAFYPVRARPTGPMRLHSPRWPSPAS